MKSKKEIKIGSKVEVLEKGEFFGKVGKVVEKGFVWDWIVHFSSHPEEEQQSFNEKDLKVLL